MVEQTTSMGTPPLPPFPVYICNDVDPFDLQISSHVDFYHILRFNCLWETVSCNRRSEHVVSAVAHREVEEHLDVSMCE